MLHNAEHAAAQLRTHASAPNGATAFAPCSGRRPASLMGRGDGPARSERGRHHGRQPPTAGRGSTHRARTHKTMERQRSTQVQGRASVATWDTHTVYTRTHVRAPRVTTRCAPLSARAAHSMWWFRGGGGPQKAQRAGAPRAEDRTRTPNARTPNARSDHAARYAHTTAVGVEPLRHVTFSRPVPPAPTYTP